HRRCHVHLRQVRPMAGSRRFRALLVGVERYSHAGIEDLPCVREDLAGLDAALRGVGYQVHQVPPDRTGLAGLRDGVQAFLLDDAGPGETLIIHLNGHGVHSGGTDYLVPSDADPRYDPFAEHCVPVDVNRDIERSRASDVVVFIDACREGFEQVLAARTKRVGPVGWSEGTIDRIANRKTAYVFGCSKGEYARFVRTDQGAFSIFSRALVELMADEHGPSTLAEFATELQVRVDELTRTHRTTPQRVRVLTESDTATLVVVVRGSQQRSRLARELAELSAKQDAALDRDGHIRPRIAGLPALPAADVTRLQAELDNLGQLAAEGRWRDAGPRVVALS